MQQAVEMFVETFFAHLSACGAAGLSGKVEQLFLLHTGGLLSLSDARYEFLVEAFICLHADRPEAAAVYAQFCPANEYCAVVLERYDTEPAVSYSQSDSIDLSVNKPAADSRALPASFNRGRKWNSSSPSAKVYPSYFAYLNGAFGVLVDCDGVRDALTRTNTNIFEARWIASYSISMNCTARSLSSNLTARTTTITRP